MVYLNKRALCYRGNDVFLESVICDLPLDSGERSGPELCRQDLADGKEKKTKERKQ